MKTKTTPPARSNNVVLKQLLKHIPRSLISEAAREMGVEAKAREFCVFSHLCSMLFAQLTHAMGLNDVRDWLRLKQGAGAVPPTRNGLLHANMMIFITIHPNWSPTSAGDLYRPRWDIEAFFKQDKQTLNLGTFLGRTANAVRWQVFSALLCGFGTAGGSFEGLGALQQAWLPGLARGAASSRGTASPRFISATVPRRPKNSNPPFQIQPGNPLSYQGAHLTLPAPWDGGVFFLDRPRRPRARHHPSLGQRPRKRIDE